MESISTAINNVNVADDCPWGEGNVSLDWHHLAVEEKRWLGRQVVALGTRVAQGTTGQEQQHRPQALAAGRNDVTGDIAHQRHARVQALGDDTVHLCHVGGDEGKNGGGAVFGG